MLNALGAGRHGERSSVIANVDEMIAAAKEKPENNPPPKKAR